MMNKHTRLRRRHRHTSIHACCCLSLFTFLLVRQNLVVILFIGADDSLDERENEEAIYPNLDTTIETINHIITSNQVVDDENAVSIAVDEISSLPAAALVKAANVGAQIREAVTSQEKKETTSIILDHEQQQHEHNMEPGILNNYSDSMSNEEYAIHPKAATTTTGCHWGKIGCRRGHANASSAVELPKTNTDPATSQEDGDSVTLSSPALSSSTLAGSATAKIKERIKKGSNKGSSSSTTMNRRKTVPNNSPVWTSSDDDDDDNNNNNNNNNDNNNKFQQPVRHGSVQKPPQGFKLAGRIVTSPSDGLSYFLDSPSVTTPEIDDDSFDEDSMMTIPYVYLECGPTIESATEAFPVMDMVLRHFPASASMGHWINLAGRVTLEKDDDDGGSSYIDTNGKNEGQPKLLIALSPIQITVSGNDEETRLFNPGDVVLMEDTLGKGHKMNAAPVPRDDKHILQAMDTPRGQDMIVLMVSLPHTVHFPIHNWLDEPSDVVTQEGNHDMLETQPSFIESTPNEDHHAPSGFAPKNLHHNRQRHKQSSKDGSRLKKPCPLEYDSAYSSLFMPTYHHRHQYRRSWRTRRVLSQRRHVQDKGSTLMSPFDTTKYPAPPGFSTYGQESLLMEYLPSLRRTMLVGLGLSLTSSIIYCAQLLYPPLLALLGGATVIIGGAFVNVLFARWSYRRFIADWEEEWRWKREVMKGRMYRETISLTQQQDQQESGIDSNTQNGKEDIEREEAII